MTKKERYTKVIEHFLQTMPSAETELHYNNVFQLICAVILSAQCTDKRVNMVSPALFLAYPTPQAMAAATKESVLPYIKSISYPNSKAEHLVQMARQVVERFDGEIPADFDSLVSLPGVGRKTANVVLSVAFNHARMAVDTHVFRVSRRIGLVPDKCITPYSVEQELMKNIPEEYVPRAHHWLILHGRYVCKSQRPKCEECGIKTACKTYKSSGT